MSRSEFYQENPEIARLMSGLAHETAARSEFAIEDATLTSLQTKIGATSLALVSGVLTGTSAFTHRPEQFVVGVLMGAGSYITYRLGRSVDDHGLDAELTLVQAEREIERIHGIDLGKYPKEEQI